MSMREHCQIKFKVGRKKYEFFASHNLSKHGLSIEVAFDNWIARTEEYTPESFRDYVLSKNIKGLKCEVL